MATALLEGIRKEMPKDRHYRSLMKRMLLIGFFLPFFPMILVGGMIFYQFDSAYKRHAYAHLTAAAENGRRNIDRFLNDKTTSLQWIARSLGSGRLPGRAALKEELGGFQGRAFGALAVLDKGGRMIAGTDTEQLGAPSNDNEAWLGNVLSSGWAVTAVRTHGMGYTSVIIGVRHGLHDAPWVLAATIDPAQLNGPLKAFGRTETASIFLFTRQRITLLAEEPDVHLGEGMMAKLLDLPVRKAPPTIHRHRKATGKEYLYAVALPTAADWVLVYRQSVAEAFAGLSRAGKFTGAVVALVGLLLALYALGLSRKTVQRIEQADVKKQKMNEKMFQTAKLASIGELAAGIAHEINNPVAIMVEEAGWVEDLLEEQEIGKAEDLAEFRRSLNQIQAQGQRCKAITHKLLSFARKTDFRVQKVRLKELIEDILAISSKRSKYDRVNIRLDIQEDLPEFMLPPTELQQVLLNLLNNAIDAVEVTRGTITITARSGNGDLFIEVSDNGPGIPKADLPRIFDPFFTTKPVGKGTGLGLSICYGIVKRMGGEIRAHSGAGTGTTFRIRIPKTVAEDPVSHQTTETSANGPEAALSSNRM